MAKYKVPAFNWKKLDGALVEICDAINSISPLEGQGIHLVEFGDQGTQINASTKGEGQSQQGGGGGGEDQPTYTKITIAGVSFQSITLVDPDTCATSTINVLTEGGSTTFDITLS